MCFLAINLYGINEMYFLYATLYFLLFGLTLVLGPLVEKDKGGTEVSVQLGAHVSPIAGVPILFVQIGPEVNVPIGQRASFRVSASGGTVIIAPIWTFFTGEVSFVQKTSDESGIYFGLTSFKPYNEDGKATVFDHTFETEPFIKTLFGHVGFIISDRVKLQLRVALFKEKARGGYMNPVMIGVNWCF